MTSAFRYNLVLALSNSAFATVHFIDLSQFFQMIGLVRGAKKSALGLLCVIMMVHLVPLTAVMKKQKGKSKVQGVLQSQTAALPRHQEKEETDKSKALTAKLLRQGYRYYLDIMQQTACLVVNPIIVDGYASLFNCTTAVRASDSMTASVKL